MEMSLTITKTNKDKVRIYVKDSTSRIKFLDLTLTLEQFASVITGLAEVKVEGEVKDLSFVGKTKITEPRSITITKDIYYSLKREDLGDWLLNNCQEDGWLLNTYLGSKSSVQWCTDINAVTLNYGVYKYI